MPTEKRPRGRPRGSGKDDSPVLAQVADFLVRDASLKATAAMRRILPSRKDWGATDETLIRRWQGKWKKERASLLAAASERARPVPVNHAPSFAAAEMSFRHLAVEQALTRQLTGATDQFLAIQRGIQDAIDPPHLRWLRQTQTLSAFERVLADQRRIQDAIDPPHLRWLRQAQAVQDLIDPPALRKWRMIEEAYRRATLSFR